MEQIHRRLTDEQIRLIFKNYCDRQLTREEVQETLGVGKSQFFVLLKEYRNDPTGFSVSYQRHTPGKLAVEEEQAIMKELKREKELVDNPEMPISSYNYSALRDRLKHKGIEVSLPMIIKQTNEMKCYRSKRKGKSHDWEAVPTAIGALIKHDASAYTWSLFTQTNGT
jgi:transposase